MKWEQLQTFYVLINLGTIAKAAKSLGVHSTTVSRHTMELEKCIGARLLKKHQGKYVTTTDGEKIYRRAAEMASEAYEIENIGVNESDEISGTVRITSIESFVSNCLIPRMPKLRKRHPKISLEFICTDDNLSFNKRETDLAVRFKKPKLVNIVTRKLGNIGFAVYSKTNSKKFASKGFSQIDDWITYDEDYSSLPEAKWINRQMNNTDPIIKSSNAAVLKAAIKADLGIGVLPCYRGDTDKSLMRISGNKPVITREAWLLIHTDYHSNPKTCSVIDWITDIFKQDKKLISGVN